MVYYSSPQTEMVYYSLPQTEMVYYSSPQTEMVYYSSPQTELDMLKPLFSALKWALTKATKTCDQLNAKQWAWCQTSNWGNFWLKICDALDYLLDNIFIRFGTKLCRQTIDIPMRTNCAPLVADLFLFCYDRDFMKSLSRENQADIIEAFNSTSRYLDDLLTIDNISFDQIVDRIYPTELQLNRTTSSVTETLFFDVNLCISNGIGSTKIMINGTIFILI